MRLKKSTYFDYIRRLPSQRHEKMLQRRRYILEIFKESNSVYGARKIQQKLIERDIHVSVKTIQNDMRSLHLVSRYCKKFKPGKSSKRQQTHTPNILKDTNVIKKHTAVVTDITYVWTSCHAWVYVLTYIDVFTRKVLHYDIGRRMTSEFVNVNTKHVLQKYPSVALIHSDQGSQYTALSYRKLLLTFNVVASLICIKYHKHNFHTKSFQNTIGLMFEKFISDCFSLNSTLK